MASDIVAPTAPQPDDKPAPRNRASSSPGFFSIYKSGQGYWTRMGSVMAAILIIALTSYNLYAFLTINFEVPAKIALGVTGAVTLGLALLCFWLINKPTNADFLIATDSEMKKVNWTSKGELIGSTKIVILFLIVVALFLFGIDVIFGYFFYLIKVLQTGPFG